MIGNDVVDLGDAEARVVHPRFDERVFSADELEALARSSDPMRLRWILWAAKEAAFKAARRRDPGVIFAPRRFVVEVDDAHVGRVIHRGEVFPVAISAVTDRVHAVVGDGSDVIVGVETGDPADPSGAARRLAVRAVAGRLGMPESDLRVERRGRIPQLHARRGGRALELSLSHHGRFVAFACRLGPAA